MRVYGVYDLLHKISFTLPQIKRHYIYIDGQNVFVQILALQIVAKIAFIQPQSKLSSSKFKDKSRGARHSYKYIKLKAAYNSNFIHAEFVSNF